MDAASVARNNPKERMQPLKPKRDILTLAVEARDLYDTILSGIQAMRLRVVLRERCPTLEDKVIGEIEKIAREVSWHSVY